MSECGREGGREGAREGREGGTRAKHSNQLVITKPSKNNTLLNRSSIWQLD